MYRLLTLLFVLSVFCTVGLHAQNVGVGTSSPDNSAKLDISAIDGGLLIPRMTEVQRDAIVTPATGLMIFQIDGTAGFYYYDGTAWTAIGSGSGAGTDDQNISGSGLSGTTLTIGIEGGSSETVDLASLQDGTGALEEITEGSNTGYRIFGRDTAKYGDIGANAVDLSNSASPSTTRGASGGSSTAMGSNTTASGYVSTAMGLGTIAPGNMSTAMGLGTTASGVMSTAMGYFTRASGFQSTAMGDFTEASGNASIAMGSFTRASGSNSTAMGGGTTASGYVSTAMGGAAEASGDFSTAMGDMTTAKSYAETSIGLNNTDYTPADSTNWNSTDRLFVIGNGQSLTAKSDAMIVYKNGNTIINGALTLSNGSDSITLPNTDGSIGQVLATDGAGNISWSTASSGTDDQDISGSGLSGTTLTIGIEGGSSEAVDLASLQDGSGALEEITEGSNTGYRISGRDAANYGDIGNNAIDLSYSNTTSTTNGATGTNSTAMGLNTRAQSPNSTAIGQSTIASGFSSTAMGSFSQAQANYTTAMGFYTTASGTYSTAMGSNTTASEDYSTAMGSNTDASGNTSTAMGGGTTASGNYSTAMGFNTEASGNNSTAMGDNTEASGNNSTAMGYGTTASEDYSTAMGYGTTASGNNSTAMGYGTTASGNTSTAMGDGTNSSGDFSTAMGYGTTASEDYSTAMGDGTTASGNASTAMGRSTTASGNRSTAMGYGTTASGFYSTAMGGSTTASGFYSTAMGAGTEASGDRSTAMGDNTTAKSYAELAIGQYNTDYTPAGAASWNTGDRLFVIGNGQSASAKSDAMIVYKSGLAEFKDDMSITGNLGLDDSEIRLRGLGDGNHYLKYQSGGGFDGPKLYGYGTLALQTNDMEVVLRNGRMGVGTASPTKGKLHVSGSDSYGVTAGGWYANNGGGTGTYGNYTFNVGIYCENDLIVSGFIATESDARLKNVSGISNASNDLETLMSIEVTDYTLKDVISQGGRDFKKVIAQQVEEVFPQAVNTTSNYIPNIYEVAEVANGQVMVTAEVAVGDKIKMFKEDGSELHVNVVATDANSFTVDSDYEGQVFIYGKEVDDFRGVDYDALSMLNISATQALYQRLVELEETNSQFQVQIDRIKAHVGLEEDNTASK